MANSCCPDPTNPPSTLRNAPHLHAEPRRYYYSLASLKCSCGVSLPRRLAAAELAAVALSNVETGTYGAVNFGLLLAGAVIAMIPCILVYVALQRYYVRGLISGALKG